MLPQRREDEDADEQVQEGDPLAPEAHPGPNIFTPENRLFVISWAKLMQNEPKRDAVAAQIQLVRTRGV